MDDKRQLTVSKNSYIEISENRRFPADSYLSAKINLFLMKKIKGNVVIAQAMKAFGAGGNGGIVWYCGTVPAANAPGCIAA